MTAFLFELDCASAVVAPAYEPYHDPYGCDVICHVTRLLLRFFAGVVRISRNHEPYDVTSIRLLIRILLHPHVFPAQDHGCI